MQSNIKLLVLTNQELTTQERSCNHINDRVCTQLFKLDIESRESSGVCACILFNSNNGARGSLPPSLFFEHPDLSTQPLSLVHS